MFNGSAFGCGRNGALVDARQLEMATWSVVDGRGSADDLALFHADEAASLAVLDRLILDTERDMAAVGGLEGDERLQVIADFADTLDGLRSTAARLRPPPAVAHPPGATDAAPVEDLVPDEVRLQASWSAGEVVVWAAGRGAPADENEALATRLEAVGGPALGWRLHPDVKLPGGARAAALAIPVKDALGWLVHVGGGNADTSAGVGPSVTWLGRVALEGVRLVARGSIVPALSVTRRPDARQTDAAVRWVPALVEDTTLGALGTAMPATVGALGGADGRTTALAIVDAVVDAIVDKGTESMEFPAPPPVASTPADLDEAIIGGLDGSPFSVDAGLASAMSRRLTQWSNPVTVRKRPRLVVQLDAPGNGGVWLLSVHVRSGQGPLTTIDAALRTQGPTGLTAEWARLRRLFPALDRVGAQRRGQVALSQDEAWEVMRSIGRTLEAAGFTVRAPVLSRRKATASLQLFAHSPAGSVVGAHQLANVSWSALFDDVELTAAEVAQLARRARPLVESNGRWVEIDRLDLERAAAALAEREAITQLTGAEILRHGIGLEGSGLGGGTVVRGDSWANDIVRRASEASTAPVASPVGFVGELRGYQAEALGWIGFLDASGLGGCLALDMGLGKTPTVLAHLVRAGVSGPALVVAPAAVVGNWAAEAARFAPGLHVVVHHGASRSSAGELRAEIADADVVITTYATAVRDIDALSADAWSTVVLDEAQAIKNPASDTAQQLRRIRARTVLALTGTPIENGLGDLWAILDFTNPGLVGPRPAFVAQMSGDDDAALRALNGILLFRRTKTEPEVAAELPDKIDELDHCTMTREQIGLYQAVLDDLVKSAADVEVGRDAKKGEVLAAITKLKQICNHPAAFRDDGQPLAGRSGKLARLEELVDSVFAAGERILVFTHFATWGRRLADHLSELTGVPIASYDGSLARAARDRLVADFQAARGPGAMVLSLKAGGTGLNLTGANHVVLYDRWWNPAVEDQARDRVWRIGQSRTVVSHRLVCPGTIDERVEEVVGGKRRIAQLVLPVSSSLADLDADQVQLAFGLRADELLEWDDR